MAGIYGFYSSSELAQKNYSEYFFSSTLPHIKNQDRQYKSFNFGSSVLNKFKQDRFIIESDLTIICFEGIHYGLGNFKEKIESWYRTHGLNFIKQLDAFFAGYIFDKQTNELHLFTDYLGTKALYYYHNEKTKECFFSSELKVLSKACCINNIPLKPNLDGFNCLLSFGYMLDNITPVEPLKRLRPGTILTFNPESGKLTEDRYFRLKKKSRTHSKEQVIDTIDELLLSSIEQEWQKDRQYNRPSFAFLSGGLDSRVNVLLAKKMGFFPFACLNFSQTGAPDHAIPQKIALQEELDYTFYKLDNGHYFLGQFERLVKANSGMVALNRAAHMFRAIENFNCTNYGLAHSGQIGDVLFGSFIKPNFNLKTDAGKLGLIDDSNIHNQISILPELLESYENNVELFSYEQRQMNGTMDGDKTISHFADLSSPFYNKDLLCYCYNLPDEYKLKKHIYFEWMLKKHPELLEYPWDISGIKYSNSLLLNASRIYRKGWRFLQKKLGIGNELMNPLDIWFKRNKKLQSEIDQLFTLHLDIVSEENLKQNIEYIYHNSIQGKFSALSALLAYKLHFKQH